MLHRLLRRCKCSRLQRFLHPEDRRPCRPASPREPQKVFKLPTARIDFVACELQIESPVAMTFDEKGRLWVVEMRIPNGPTASPRGRIRILEDKDGDGFYETTCLRRQPRQRHPPLERRRRRHHGAEDRLHAREGRQARRYRSPYEGFTPATRSSASAIPSSASTASVYVATSLRRQGESRGQEGREGNPPPAWTSAST